MPTEKFRVDNPAFNEFLYSVLYNASLEAKRIIPPRLLKFLNSEREAKKFIRRATMEEARSILAYLGIEHFMVFVAKDNAHIKDFKIILDKYKDQKKLASLQDIIDLKLFVTSDKELITLLGLMSQTIHHKAYTMNLELTRTGYHLRKWGKHLDSQPSLEIQENSNVLAKTLLSSSLTLNKSEFLFQLSPLDIQVLLYLYPLKHTYANISQLHAFFAGHLTKRRMTDCVKHLMAVQYIHPSAVSNEREYTISGLGIRIINQYMETVLQANSLR